jgi:hypothetical protein
MLARYGLAAALLTTGAPLRAADPTQFLRLCEATVPVATCGCIANELQRSRDGQISLDAYAATLKPPAQRQSAMVGVANKYGSKFSELKAAVDRLRPVMDSLIDRCK